MIKKFATNNFDFRSRILKSEKICGQKDCGAIVQERSSGSGRRGRGRYCKHCRTLRSRAKKDGLNPDIFSQKILHDKYWFALNPKKLDAGLIK